MTVRETSVTIPIDSLSSAASTRRLHSPQTVPALKKRSPSPLISFTAAPLPNETKGVKNITREVMRSLEGLGHFGFIDTQGRMVGIDEQPDDGAIRGTESETLKQRQRHVNGQAKRENGSARNGMTRNGSAQNAGVETLKIDWEIPRKILHSSIGFFTLYLYVSEGSVRNTVIMLWSALTIIVPADIIRLRFPAFERVYERVLGFLMRESEKNTSNGVIWYILGVNLVLSFYPTDVAVVAILILSWADTTASTFGRMFGRRTPPLPRRLPLLRLPLASRKSVAGFIAASVTGACIAIGFWGWIAPLRNNGADLTWTWQGCAHVTSPLPTLVGMEGSGNGGSSGWIRLGAIGLVTGLVTGVTEALDLGTWDDNLTLPIISGGCILAFLKLLSAVS
ncbi:hypothetical protein AX17_001897 [Amanita inopinata Kibby_2008]|nr:hypothetical protein AX17_001897 [Amanita inopinata Kibby_2008]